MKEKIKRMIFTVVLVVITMILSTILSVYATTTILGSEVGYTDTNNRLKAYNNNVAVSNVQAAIDATYSSALSLDSRVTTLESNDFITARTVTGTITRKLYASASITASSVSGYKFSHWASCTSSSWIGSLIIPSATSTSTYIYISGGAVSAENATNAPNGNFICVAVYTKTY